jgi:hypothetical protein
VISRVTSSEKQISEIVENNIHDIALGGFTWERYLALEDEGIT